MRAIVANGNWPSKYLEGSFLLTEDNDPNGILLAEAVIGSHDKRVVAGPLSDRDREVFVAHNYTIYAPTDLQPDHL